MAVGFILLLIPGLLIAQRSVKGTVTDPGDDSSIPGAAVLLKGTSTGVVTDIDGNFEVTIPESGGTLIFSSVGYQTQEVIIGTQSVINIAMPLDIQQLDEVVVIGYGQIEKGDITGVVSKVDSRTFNRGVLTSPDQLIAGKVAGVQITSNSGRPGDQVSIRLRGGTSLSASNEPLFVVDGVPLDNSAHNPGGMTGGRNPLNFINPADIADITVLKDASAAAIYGSRGANGVIIITTKSGASSEPGKVRFSYDGNYSASVLTQRVDVLNRDEFVFTVERRGQRWVNSLGNANTDWTEEVLQLAHGHNHTLSASMGGEGTTFRASVNYQDLSGVLQTENTERISGSLNLTQKLLNDNLTLQLNTKHALTNDRFAPNVVGTALLFDPTQPIRNDNAETGFYYEHEQELAPDNPVSTINQTYEIGRSYRNLINLSATYDFPFLEGLSGKVNYAHDRTDGKRQRFQPETLQSVRNQQGWFQFEDFNRNSNLLETYLTYTTEIAGNNKMELTGGYSYQDFFREFPNYRKIDTIPVSRYGISDPLSIIEDSRLEELNSILFKPQFDQFENRLISFWGRANFTLLDRYLLTATLRRDGSTRFGEDNRWGLFPSLAVGWRILDESFADGLTTIFTDLKLRVSYGVTGSQEIEDYLYVNLYESGQETAQYIFGNDTVNTLRPNAVDPSIKWEETQSWNVGLDYGILGGKIHGTLDFYRKLTSDLLFEIPFPAGTLTGDEAVTNIGEMENMGVELSVNANLINTSELKWDISFNGSYNKNEILKLDNSNLPDFIGYPVGGISGQGLDQRIQILRVGSPANSFFTYEHIRDENGNPVPDMDRNGDRVTDDLDVYVDQNGDGVINQQDLIVGENPAPDFILGFTSNTQWKNWDFSLTLRAQLGNWTYNNVFSQNGAFEGVNNNFAPNNIHRSAYTNEFSSYQVLSDVYLENGSFMRVDNFTVGYTFKNLEAINLRTYLTASNPLLITGYSGLDPEAGINGIDNNLYPRSQTFLFGVSAQF